MTHAKKRTEQHLIDADAQALLAGALPRQWVLREYRPDYGIDYDVEVFSSIQPSQGRTATQYETLGEHVFVQLKGVKKARRETIKVYSHQNVEKTYQTEGREELIAETEVIPFPLEVPELVTIQRMGAALPVLLVVADLTSRSCYFLCLNDYIDKILIPRHRNYESTARRTVHVPVRNILADPVVGLTALRWYAKRAKLFAAFQKFVYQDAELRYAADSRGFLPLAKHFASILRRYDFWEDTEMWPPIPLYGRALTRFLEEGSPGLTQINNEGLRAAACSGVPKDIITAFLKQQEIPSLWRALAVLPRNFEEVCREWFLPSPLGVTTSYP